MKRILFLLALLPLLNAMAADKRILLIAGKPSHGPGDHEFRAGCLLLKKCLDGIQGVQVEVHTNGWPADEAVFDHADAVVIYADGGAGHPAIQGERMKRIDDLIRKGVGFGCMHYAVEVPAGAPGEAMQRWIGGYYEHQYSVNPMWVPDCRNFPQHPVTAGVGPFQLLDEWYFNMRWAKETNGITHLLVDKPSDKVRHGPYVYPPGPYDHIVAASGREETMMWTFQRPDGGRSFGFTGGHKHVNWSNDQCRKIVLNAIVWIAKAEIPGRGVSSEVPAAELANHLDPKGTTASAPNLTGKWNCHVETANRSGDPVFTFVHAGQNLLGTYDGQLGAAVVYGSVGKSNAVRFSFTAKRDDQEVPVTYTGQIQDATAMNGKVKFGESGEGTWTARK